MNTKIFKRSLLPLLAMTLSYPSAKAMTNTELKTCLESDIQALNKSQSFYNDMKILGVSGTAIYTAMTRESLDIFDKGNKQILAIIKDLKTCSEILSDKKLDALFQKEFSNFKNEIQKDWIKDRKNIIGFLNENGMQKAAETITANELLLNLAIQMNGYREVGRLLGDKGITTLAEDIVNASDAFDIVTEKAQDAYHAYEQKVLEYKQLPENRNGIKDNDPIIAKFELEFEQARERVDAEIAEILAGLTAQEIEKSLHQYQKLMKIKEWKDVNSWQPIPRLKKD